MTPKNNKAVEELEKALYLIQGTFFINDEGDKKLGTTGHAAAKEAVLAWHQSQLDQFKERAVAALPEKDKHKHMTRNYCLDCAKRDGFNHALDQAAKAIKELK